MDARFVTGLDTLNEPARKQDSTIDSRKLIALLWGTAEDREASDIQGS